LYFRGYHIARYLLFYVMFLVCKVFVHSQKPKGVNVTNAKKKNNNNNNCKN